MLNRQVDKYTILAGGPGVARGFFFKLKKILKKLQKKGDGYSYSPITYIRTVSWSCQCNLGVCGTITLSWHPTTS